MIQDIAPHKLNNQFDPKAQASPSAFVLHFRGGEVLAKKTETEITFLCAGECAAKNLIFLFRIDAEEEYYLIDDDTFTAPDGYEYFNLRRLRAEDSLRPEQAFAVYTARHLADWYRDTRFCGRCGSKTGHSQTERAKVCPKCGYTAYPRIMPAVIVGVKRGEELLLTRYRNDLGYNALVAGFTEIGETLEETVAREVLEETGVKVKNICYYKSQPWGIANDILVGYYCEADGDGKIRLDENELSRAVWTKREDIELQPGNYSLTNEMMREFKEGRQ